jgi:hypothetical protein
MRHSCRSTPATLGLGRHGVRRLGPSCRNTLDLLEASGMRVAEVDRRTWSAMPRLVRPLAIGSTQIR